LGMANKSSKLEQEAKKTRKTRSYGMWRMLGDAYDKGGVVELYVAFYKALDERRAFGSQTNADAAWRSLKQFLLDKGVPQRKVDALQ
jgi:hypothetical protein